MSEMRQLGSSTDSLRIKHSTDLFVGRVDSGESGGESGDEVVREVYVVGMVQIYGTMSSGGDNCEHRRGLVHAWVSRWMTFLSTS